MGHLVYWRLVVGGGVFWFRVCAVSVGLHGMGKGRKGKGRRRAKRKRWRYPCVIPWSLVFSLWSLVVDFCGLSCYTILYHIQAYFPYIIIRCARSPPASIPFQSPSRIEYYHLTVLERRAPEYMKSALY